MKLKFNFLFFEEICINLLIGVGVLLAFCGSGGYSFPMNLMVNPTMR